MPFITQERRHMIATRTMVGDPQPGDLCYGFYKPLVDAWRENPRWTTAHELYKMVLRTRDGAMPDEVAAMDLAWQVFFNLHVLKYEEKKRKENGDV